MDFKHWLMYFKDVDRPIGDLCRDVIKDMEFPNLQAHQHGYAVGAKYLFNKGASDTCVSTFIEAYKYYQSESS